MNYCVNCGHELGVGRFCTNCGRPVAGRHPGAPTDESPQTPAPTSPPPAVGTLPPPPRFPLYADAPPPPPPVGRRPRRGGLLLWVAVVLALVVVGAAVAAFSLIGSGSDRPAVDSSRPVGQTPPPASPTTTPTATGRQGTDLVPDIEHIAVPGTAPASTDLAGKPVSFGAANLTDGDPQTAWRMVGDGSGKALTLTFDQPVTITSVGLINGYAKAYPGYNGYLLNRKITAVVWTFDDGTSVTQRLGLRRTMQSMPVSAGPTSSLRLQIVSTTASATPNWRDFTAISELSLRSSR